jgi:hypothetical protein
MSVNFQVDSLHFQKKLLGIVGETMRSFYFFRHISVTIDMILVELRSNIWRFTKNSELCWFLSSVLLLLIGCSQEIFYGSSHDVGNTLSIMIHSRKIAWQWLVFKSQWRAYMYRRLESFSSCANCRQCDCKLLKSIVWTFILICCTQTLSNAFSKSYA